MMISTETERAQIAQALLAGADEYVMKPFTPSAFTAKMQLLGLVT